MKKLPWLNVALLLVSAPAAFASPGNGVDLTWDDCVGGAAALNDKIFTCDGAASTVPYKLIGCYKVATNMPDFYAMDISIDLQQADGQPLVPFYRYEAGPPAGCNNDALTVNDARTQAGSFCGKFATAWGPTGTAPAFTGITAYAPNFLGQNGHGRLFISIARASNNPFPLVGGTNYYAFHLEFYDYNASQAGGACTGCGTPATVTWNSATLFGNSETVVLTGPDKKSVYCATINQGVYACLDVVPIRNTTWGQLKSIYR